MADRERRWLGGDARHGQLFTRADVQELMDCSHATGKDLYELLAGGPRLTFPADEPLFLLRGQDKAAPDAISTGCHPETFDYERSASAVGAGMEHLDAIAEAADRMRAWQAANPDRVKVPGLDG